MKTVFFILTLFFCHAKSEYFLDFVYNLENYDFNPSYVYSIDNEDTYKKVVNDRTKTVILTLYVSAEWCCKFR